VFRKADALPDERRAEFIALRDRYQLLMVTNLAFQQIAVGNKSSPYVTELPHLPLRDSVQAPGGCDLVVHALPDDVLDAGALRPLMERLISHTQIAIAEFDAVFGERA
jgi:restriction system protein